MALMLGSLLTHGDSVCADEAAPSATDAETPSFLESIYCSVCHANSNRAGAMRDQNQRGIAPFDLWQSTAMAHSARDPFWRAVVSAEVAATPSQKELIERKCSRCHAPMGTLVQASPPNQVLAHLTTDNDSAQLSNDGVSCTVCHQIRDIGLGTEDSFTGGFRIGAKGLIYGPHAEPFSMPMLRHTGYTPVQSKHLLRSALCATCHTLDTDALRPDGSATGDRLHEQSPYREWRNSVYNDEQSPAEGVGATDPRRSCQACHMPTTDVEGQVISTRIAHNPGGRDFPFLRPRSPFGRHTMSGGNTLLTSLMQAVLEPTESSAMQSAFDRQQTDSRTFLSTAARVIVGETRRTSNELEIPVTVENLAGHKLPTGYPSRRVWLHVEVRTADGQLLFASGRYDSQGYLLDTHGDRLPCESTGGPVLPHFQTIDQSDEVQVYQAIMEDVAGDVTFTLLRGARYAKDNRLLPRGWQADHRDAPATAPVGTDGDADFAGGNDTVVYALARPATFSGTLTVEAWLHYQSIAPRWIQELLRRDTPEIRTFEQLYRNLEHPTETVAHTRTTIAL